MSNHCKTTPILWEGSENPSMNNCQSAHTKKSVFLTAVRQGNRAAASAPLGKCNLALGIKLPGTLM